MAYKIVAIRCKDEIIMTKPFLVQFTDLSVQLFISFIAIVSQPFPHYLQGMFERIVKSGWKTRINGQTMNNPRFK